MRGEVLIAAGVIVAIVGAILGFYSASIWEIHRVTWGLLVALYEYFGVLAAGSAILASIVVLARIAGYISPEAERVAKLGLVLAVAGLLAAGFTVALKSGFPTNIHYAFFSGKFESAIARMVVLLPVFIIVSIVTIAAMTLKNAREVKALLAVLVVLVAILAYANAGSVFQSMASVPLWYATPMTALFIAGAVAWGASAQSLYVLVSERRIAPELARVYGATIALGSLAYAAILYFTQAGYTGVAAEAWARIEASTLFTISFYLLALLAPLVLGFYAAVTGDYKPVPIAAISAIIGGFIVHAMLVIVPQTIALTGFREIVEIEYHLARDELVGAIGATLLLLGLLAAGTGILSKLEKPQEKK